MAINNSTNNSQTFPVILCGLYIEMEKNCEYPFIMLDNVWNKEEALMPVH